MTEQDKRAALNDVVAQLYFRHRDLSKQTTGQTSEMHHAAYLVYRRMLNFQGTWAELTAFVQFNYEGCLIVSKDVKSHYLAGTCTALSNTFEYMQALDVE
jgi:hypothetical protein